MIRDQRGRTSDAQSPPETAEPGTESNPDSLADSSRFRKLGSALNWVGDRVAVVGADPAGVIAEAATGLVAERDVVTVIGPLDTPEDWSFVETVLPIAVPPGSRGRVAVAGAAGRGLVGRLARELTATLDVPRAEVLLVPGGSLFAVDGWVRHTPDGVTAPAGHRSPQPSWENDVDELCATTCPGDLALLPVPAGMWLFRRLPGTPMPDYDDPAYGVPMDADRPVLLIGRPGQPEPEADAIAEFLDRLPSHLRQQLVLASYGSVTTTAAAATSLARETGVPVQVHTGLPALTPEGRPTSLAVDHSAATWEPIATVLSFPADGPARPVGPVRGLDGYPELAENVFRLGERWVAEVTQSGLWVRPPEQEHGARLVRSHPWTSGKVRIFVGVPGKPPRYHVLPVLGALLGRMPAETRRRVELSPARFAVAAGDDAVSTPDSEQGALEAPVVQRTVVLRAPQGGAAISGPAAAVPGLGTPSPGRDTPIADPVTPGAGPARPITGGVPPMYGPPASTGGPVTSKPDQVAPTGGRIPERGREIESGSRADETTAPLVGGHAGGNAPAGPDPVAEPTTQYPIRPVARHEAVRPVRRDEPGPKQSAQAERPPRTEVAAPPAGPDDERRHPSGSGPVGPDARRRRRPRLSAQILTAVAVLTVAVASGYVLNPNGQPSGADTPPGYAVPPPPGLPEFPAGTPVASDPSGTPADDPSTSVSPASGSSGQTSAAPGPSFPGRSPASSGGTDRVPAPVAPPRPTGSPSSAPSASPQPAASSAMPGRVNSSGRNLALSGTASASSFETIYRPSSAIDGDRESRWGSAFTPDTQWLAVDLGELWQVTEVRLRWERAYATAYRVEVSADGGTWRTVYQTASGAGGTVDIAVTRTPVRYVRMVGTAKVMTGYGYSIHEFEVR
ncbi:discoidin domain-containing protein [Micromonospora sp. NPDC049903]|uniref:galactose-binding domain-containing protein n=1 Tax=Micromonospora sp. NPDC049903 TaxID=3364276 RepID=UPI0037A83F9E